MTAESKPSKVSLSRHQLQAIACILVILYFFYNYVFFPDRNSFQLIQVPAFIEKVKQDEIARVEFYSNRFYFTAFSKQQQEYRVSYSVSESIPRDLLEAHHVDIKIEAPKARTFERYLGWIPLLFVLLAVRFYRKKFLPQRPKKDKKPRMSRKQSS